MIINLFSKEQSPKGLTPEQIAAVQNRLAVRRAAVANAEQMLTHTFPELRLNEPDIAHSQEIAQAVVAQESQVIPPKQIDLSTQRAIGVATPSAFSETTGSQLGDARAKIEQIFGEAA